MTTQIPAPTSAERPIGVGIPETPSAPSDERRRAPWPRVLMIGLAAFAVWLVVFAPTLQHNAQVSPVGTRRTVSMDVVGPVAALSRGLQLSHIVSITGREGGLPGGNAGGLSTAGPKVTTSHPVRAPHASAGGRAVAPAPALPVTPTAADPLRVLILGDSVGLDMGGPLQSDLAGTGVVTASLDARESTGLTRPDYFNWPAELQSDLKTVKPQVVVIMMGANDAQDFPGPPDVPYTSPQWNVLYAQRVAQFMHLAESEGAEVIWLGMPPMQNPGLSAQMSDIDTVDQREAALQRPPVHYLSTWTVLGTPQGTYTAFITNSSGQVVNVRAPDGTHLTSGGGQVLAQLVMNELGNLGYRIP